MYRLIVYRLIAIGAVALALTGRNLLADDTRAPLNNSSPPTSAAPTTDDAAKAQSGETWRYRRHQGLWWYWLPSNKWVYWTDGKWVAYNPETYAKFNASRQGVVSSPNTGYYRSSDPYWGAWGPVRYNSYGEVQYPYSQRKFGMRQLGAVPTPAGVRSLPGWGGER